MQDKVVTYLIEKEKKVVGNYFLLDLAYAFLHCFITNFTCDKESDFGIARSTMQTVYLFWEKVIISTKIIIVELILYLSNYFDFIYPEIWNTYSVLPPFSVRRHIAQQNGNQGIYM